MTPQRSCQLVLMVLALAAMVVGLVGQVMTLARTSSELEEVDRLVAIHAGPSVVELNMANDDLDELERLIARRRHSSSGGSALLDAQIESARRSLEEHLTAYLALDIEKAAAGRLHAVRMRNLPVVVGFGILSTVAAAAMLAMAYTALRKVERKAAELDAFAGRVAHDLLGPLMTVNIAFAAAEPCVSASEHPRVRGMMSRAGTCIGRVGQSSADLLDYARAGAAPSPDARTDAVKVPAVPPACCGA